MESQAIKPGARLRVAEKLTIGFFGYTTIAAFVFPLELGQRLVLVGLNLLACLVILLLSRHGVDQRSPFLAIARDWLPCILILVAYRESGLFFRPDPAHRLDHLFLRWDDALLKNPWVLGLLTVLSPWLQRYLELAYLFCYPSVPLALGSLYLARRVAPGFSSASAALEGVGENRLTTSGCAAPLCRKPPAFRSKVSTYLTLLARFPERLRLSAQSSGGAAWMRALFTHALKGGATARDYGLAINQFWTAALLAAFSCYVLYPFFPLTPPRELFHDLPGPPVAPLLRGVNHWVLGRYAVGASLFPSAHVATVTAVALVIRAYLPRVGVGFLILAGSIALATVYGRYHYAADALAGVLVGVAAFLASRGISRQRKA